MSRAVRLLLFLALVAYSIYPAAAQAPRFDSLYIQAIPAGERQGYGTLEKGQAAYVNTPMRDLIAAAYGVTADKVVGGPSWLATNLYTFRAKAAAETAPEQLQQMMQAALTERFSLKAHTEQRPAPAFALTVAKGQPKLKPAADPEKSGGCQVETAAISAAASGPLLRVFNCVSVGMADLAVQLPRIGPAYINLPVLDRTGLTGKFDFSLSFFAAGAVGQPSDPNYDPGNGVTLFSAIEKLGLKLNKVEAPVAVVVVDAVNPTVLVDAAHPMITPPASTAFEVADIKPVTTVTRGMAGYRVGPGGEVTICCNSLQFLIITAYNINADRIVNAPKWLNDDHWSIQAKTAPGTTMYDLDPMLQDLLKTRFGLVVHDDTQPMQVYSLHADDHPKLTHSAAAGAAGCNPSQGESPNVRLFTCSNMTMAQFAAQLQRSASGYFDHPVVDMTGLSGTWDFSFSFAPMGMTGFLGGRAGAAEPPPPTPGALTVFEALSKQLGLKAVADKQPIPVIVIDHLDRTPTAN